MMRLVRGARIEQLRLLAVNADQQEQCVAIMAGLPVKRRILLMAAWQHMLPGLLF